jgi:hypothetical protein
MGTFVQSQVVHCVISEQQSALETDCISLLLLLLFYP